MPGIREARLIMAVFLKRFREPAASGPWLWRLAKRRERQRMRAIELAYRERKRAARKEAS